MLPNQIPCTFSIVNAFLSVIFHSNDHYPLVIVNALQVVVVISLMIRHQLKNSTWILNVIK